MPCISHNAIDRKLIWYPPTDEEAYLATFEQTKGHNTTGFKKSRQDLSHAGHVVDFTLEKGSCTAWAAGNVVSTA